MKKLRVLAFLLGASFAAHAADIYAPHEFDFNGLAYGTVESVREVALPQGDIFEHAVRPEAGDELIVRLDNGSTLTVVQQRKERFDAGQRVRVTNPVSGVTASERGETAPIRSLVIVNP